MLQATDCREEVFIGFGADTEDCRFRDKVASGAVKRFNFAAGLQEGLKQNIVWLHFGQIFA